MKKFNEHIIFEENKKELNIIRDYVENLISEYLKDGDSILLNSFEDGIYEFNLNISNKNSYTFNEINDIVNKITDKIKHCFNVSDPIIKGFKYGIGFDYIIPKKILETSNLYISLINKNKYNL